MTARRSGTTSARRPASARRGSSAGRTTASPRRDAQKAAAARARARRRRRRSALAVVVVLAVLGAMSVGPIQTLIAATERVDTLAASRDQLAEEVDRLEERRAELNDPEELELIARSELGLVKPGEQPYVVVRPEDEVERVHPDGDGDPSAAEASPDDAWYRRLGRALGLLD